MLLERVKRLHSNGERLSKTTHMPKQYCPPGLECYSSLKTPERLFYNHLLVQNISLRVTLLDFLLTFPSTTCEE